MANQTTNIDTILTAQASKEVTANAFFDAASPATLYGRRASTCGGLVWGFYGGKTRTAGGVVTEIANGTLTLPDNSTTYVEANPSTGAVSQNIAGWTPGFVPLYQLTTSGGVVTTYTDKRMATISIHRKASKAMTNADVTLTAEEASCEIMEVTGTLTANVSLYVPAYVRQFTVYNGTTGAYTLTFKATGGTGVVVATGKRAIVYCDGTNVVRVTADA